MELPDLKKIFENLIFQQQDEPASEVETTAADTVENTPQPGKVVRLNDVEGDDADAYDGPRFLKRVTRNRSINSVLVQQRYMQNAREKSAKEKGDEALEKLRMKRSSYVEFEGPSDLEDHKAEIILQETLKIQSMNAFRLWFERYFVLRATGIYYYKDKAAVEGEEEPKGQILFRDLITPQGKAADLIASSNLFTRLVGVPYWFQLHTEGALYTISTKTKELQKLWVDTINEKYEEFKNDVAIRNGLMESAWMWGEAESWEYFQNLIRQGNSVTSVVETMSDELLENLEDQMIERTNVHYLTMTFEAWKFYTKRKIKTRKLKAKKEETLADP
mmetsp:Transcript_25524/g.31374  ORF Transcript_25524/g.31374 Transcript_25524/m.31374 type:complete len:332 (-) Transcript_25524:320-1315(-)|eukprot:CAMPEP_0204833538 /NCGR_PEP_ID=MMETSP1346-20131115/17057_1 /ASSEMBLY_ACC=CAM_ASM_000771 /TAXON_ID=215587 /ORGANISM="Aplanochytrium stocchinoi, Strain GSBS06" /LENGTH=331 /DNA_ID=CAMNT_0051966135 /DNA_START=276 /DNA_END=1271 /DNA_ORIENTATION=-